MSNKKKQQIPDILTIDQIQGEYNAIPLKGDTGPKGPTGPKGDVGTGSSAIDESFSVIKASDLDGTVDGDPHEITDWTFAPAQGFYISSGFNVSTGRFTVVNSGKYHIVLSVQLFRPNLVAPIEPAEGFQYIVEIAKNPDTDNIVIASSRISGTIGYSFIEVQTDIVLNTGDIIVPRFNTNLFVTIQSLTASTRFMANRFADIPSD
jgi:hypothetical protein